MADWRRDVLRSIPNAQITPETLAFMDAWGRAEGGGRGIPGKSSAFNWLNTTSHAPGSTNYNDNGGYPVQNFPDYQTGVQATVKTILNGHYGNIVKGLQSGWSPAQLASAVAASPWGTGHGVERALGVKGSSVPSPTPSNAGESLTAPQSDPRAGLLAQLMGANAKFVDGGQEGFSSNLLSKVLKARTMQSTTPEQATGKPAASNGQFLQAPMAGSYKGTHVTDGLGWGSKTAEDIMAHPGTQVGAPEDGVIERHGSAQGGQSLYFRSDSGREYWLGHIESNVPVGTRVRAGQPIATISADHKRPHLHVDWRNVQ